MLENVRKSYRFSAVRASLGCDGGLIAVQRGAYGNAAGALLQSREASVGPHPGPPQGEEELTPFVYGYE